jgi:exodeoxyribonuclease VII small subunit
MSQTSNIAEEPDFEQLFGRLQQIVARLESGDLPLEEALTLYEEGVRTAGSCQQLLDAAQLRVRTLRFDPAVIEVED